MVTRILNKSFFSSKSSWFLSNFRCRTNALWDFTETRWATSFDQWQISNTSYHLAILLKMCLLGQCLLSFKLNKYIILAHDGSGIGFSSPFQQFKHMLSKCCVCDKNAISQSTWHPPRHIIQTPSQPAFAQIFMSCTWQTRLLKVISTRDQTPEHPVQYNN